MAVGKESALRWRVLLAAVTVALTVVGQTRVLVRLVAIVAVTLALVATAYFGALRWVTRDAREIKEYHPPPAAADPALTDDVLPSAPPTFDDRLVDSRPLDQRWRVNLSAAVTRLDCPLLKPDEHAELLRPRPSYADACRAARTGARGQYELLPSANLIDGAAKQFDDGLYAALDLACYRGELGLVPAPAAMVQRLFAKLPADSPARPFLAAALDLAGQAPPAFATPTLQAVRQRWLAEFDRDEARSKPISFYTWSPDLERVWRFCCFLQHEFTADSPEVQAIAAVLQADPELLRNYHAVNAFYRRLTNRLNCRSVAERLAAQPPAARHETYAVFPPSTSRETELFAALFPQGVPPDVNLMTEFIRRIRSGAVDLAPDAGAGWYQYQVYALETMLLPGRGAEKDKLLLSAAYKKRLVEAFQALLTKRRETHARQLALPAGEPPGPSLDDPVLLAPRLRLEPLVTFYLRTARAYAFLDNFLTATVGPERLGRLHGLRPGGQRDPSLAAELAATRLRFYGFYLLACEDIGLRPAFLPDEPVAQAAAIRAAADWLQDAERNPDLAVDTRVCIPICRDASGTRFWATIGVRSAGLVADYALPPHVALASDLKAWRAVTPSELLEARYALPVDEFVEFALPGSVAFTREQWRALCDQHPTKEALLEVLGRTAR